MYDTAGDSRDVCISKFQCSNSTLKEHRLEQESQILVLETISAG